MCSLCDDDLQVFDYSLSTHRSTVPRFSAQYCYYAQCKCPFSHGLERQ